jgi:hypothetical protein
VAYGKSPSDGCPCLIHQSRWSSPEHLGLKLSVTAGETSCSRVHFQLHRLKVRYFHLGWPHQIRLLHLWSPSTCPVMVLANGRSNCWDLEQSTRRSLSEWCPEGKARAICRGVERAMSYCVDTVEQDWRMVRSDGQNRTWFKRDQEEQFNTQSKLTTRGDTGALSARRTGTRMNDYAEPQAHKIHIFGRPLHIPWAMGGTSKSMFSQICDEVCA